MSAPITTGDDDQKFHQRISAVLETVQDWDHDIETLKQCRSVLPWSELRDPYGKYSSKQQEEEQQQQDRLLDSANAIFVQRLCRWYKHDFMTWVNNPPCKICASTTTQFKETRGPESQEEKDGGASRVEVYFCPQCNDNTTTFPRYNKCKAILETKRGRCGEYANLFGCICRSLGLETRYVLDVSDHVWTEIRIQEHWMMVDSCEAVVNQPSMYEDGWGKGPKLSYMIGIANDHVMDVTARYTRSFLKEQFQLRRREYTTSEDTSSKIIQQINDKVQSGLTKNKRDDLTRRWNLELAELQMLKQATEWTQQEKYGRGRISGSLAWKQSRLEAGGKKGDNDDDNNNNNDTNKNLPTQQQEIVVVPSFEVEAFYSPTTTKSISLQVYPNPTKHHNGIVVANTPCAIGEPNTVSVVVVDDIYLGCILQSKSFTTWNDIGVFINKLPSNRIVIMNGKCKQQQQHDENAASQAKEDKGSSPNNNNNKKTTIEFPRLGGWNPNNQDDIDSKGILYIGQIDAHPDWTYWSTLDDGAAKNGYLIELRVASSSSSSEQQPPPVRLRTEKQTIPQVVAGRLPESIMPLQTQLLATEEQKRMAFTKFCSSSPDTNGRRYCGYTTKPKSPVYLLDSTSYPFSKTKNNNTNSGDDDNAWNTFHYLPSPLVSDDDHGIVSNNKAATTIPKYDVPLDSTFFNRSLGSQLLTGQNNATLPTSDALHNARLIGLYFSASWCGPCRQFTPMLAEMYVHLKEEQPSHGLEIVFVSSDRDLNSFQNYFSKMPWQAIPFPNLEVVKSNLSMTYGVRGIPSFVVLDAVSGQVVVSAQESRREVATACRGGEASIEAMLDSWLARTPQESREILTMLELSCQEVADDSSKKAAENGSSENPYLVGEEKQPKEFDLAAEVKKIFEKLVAEGSDPTAAAAKAITLAAEAQKKGPKLEPGSLNGTAVRTGTPSNGEALDEAFANAIVWNKATDVSVVLATASKYVKNAIKEPWSSKFRTLKLSNKVADQITRVEGGLKLLQCLGFELFATNQDFKATIPVSLDLDETIRTIERLLEGAADS